MKRSAWRYLWMSEDIRKKLLITVGLLILYRLLSNVPVPGIDREVIRSLSQQTGAAGNLVNLLDLLSGGTVSNFSILAMGVYPYITAQIILQLLVPIIPALERRLKENPREGQAWMERWTVILTIPMAALSAIGQINIFNSMLGGGVSVLKNFGFTGASLITDPGDADQYDRWNHDRHLAGTIDLRIWYPEPGSFTDHFCRYRFSDARQSWSGFGR